MQDGASPAGPLPGLVWAFDIDRHGQAHELASAGRMPAASDGGWRWLHFDLVNVGCVAALAALPGLPIAAHELLTSLDDHQQIHQTQGCVFGILLDFVRELHGAAEETGLLHFAMTDRLLVTGRRRKLNAMEASRQAIRKGHPVPRPIDLLELMVDAIAAAVDRHAERLARQLDQVEDQLLAAEGGDEGAILGRVRRTAVRLHRQLSGIRSLFHRIERDDQDETADTLGSAAVRLSQRFDGLDQEIVALRDRARLLQEEVAMQIANETNRHVQTLSIVTALFLPATLVTGVFGMNTHGLPFEADEQGFWWAMALVIGAAAALIYVLKRMGVLGRR